MRAIYGFLRLVLFATLALFGSASAQVAVDIGGSVEAHFGVAVDGTLPVTAALLDLTLSGEIGAGLFPDASFSATLEAGYDASSGDMWLGLDEAYGDLYLGDVDLSVGLRRLSWGSTDGVNPVDVLNPRDLSFPPAARKIAVPLLHASYYPSREVRLEAVVVPVFTPSELPGERWRAAQMPAASAPVPGVNVVGSLPPEVQLPGAELGNVQFGVRLTGLLNGGDVSATYFHGFRNEPTPHATLVPGEAPATFMLQPLLSYDRIDLIGLDFSATIGEVVLRGEAAYVFTGDPTGSDPAIGNHSLQAVLGGDYLIPGGPRAIVQGIFDYRAADAGESAETTFKTMTALSYQAGARTQLDLGWLQSLDGSGALLPSVGYTLADGVTGEASAYVFYGARGTEFGGWRENAQLRLALKYSF